MTTARAKELADRYKEVLRKSDEHTFDRAPMRVQKAVLALHQHATLYWWYERRIDQSLTWEQWKAAGCKSSNKKRKLA